MNCKRFALMALLFGCSVPAMAQSSVVLFGSIDEGLTFTNNTHGSRAYQINGSDVVTSRWGLRGTEDLGGGLNAIFTLQSSFNLENGTFIYANRMFGFQSYVGLQSDSLGTLTIGRQFDVIADTVGWLTANGSWAGYLFAHPVDNDNTDASVHANNSVKYVSPTWKGFTAEGLYGFSNGAGSFSDNRLYGLGLNYSIGDLTLASFYEELGSPGVNDIGAVPSVDANFLSDNQKIWGAAAAYKIGNATVGVTYTRTNIKQATSSVYVGQISESASDLKFDNYEANIKYYVEPDWFVGGAYTYTNARLGEGGENFSIHWNQVSLMTLYSLSKRTSVYAQVAYQKVSGGAPGSILDYAYIPGSAGVASGTSQLAARLALIVNF
ncbi:porin [Paraburkholderia tropica]|uniref:porin n=1 Tax=Paraburkholderia tropica TaxID=92647 RepID=UPI001FC8C9CF|nr:porin [Paraburkholderia tropica]